MEQLKKKRWVDVAFIVVMVWLSNFTMGAITTIIRNKGQLLSTIVYTDQNNTFTSGLLTVPANGSTVQGFKETLASSQGVPTSGTHTAGEYVTDSIGNRFVCTSGGTPGTWMQIGPPTGTMMPWTGNTTPTGWIICDGAQYNRTTFSGLFAALCKGPATVTMTIASPCVVTWTSNALNNNDPIKFYTSGSLPTGLVAGTTYYVVSRGTDGTDKFRVAATVGGTAINTSGSQSGTHTGISAPYGDGFNAGAATTNFNVPDMRGRVPVGADTFYGISAAGVLTSSGYGNNRSGLGVTAGADVFTLITANLPSHTHTGTTASNGSHTHTYFDASNGTGINGNVGIGSQGTPNSSNMGTSGAHTHTFTSDATGSGTSVVNLQPSITVNWIIKN